MILRLKVLLASFIALVVVVVVELVVIVVAVAVVHSVKRIKDNGF